MLVASITAKNCKAIELRNKVVEMWRNKKVMRNPRRTKKRVRPTRDERRRRGDSINTH
jgi:hypothetical protein